MCGIVGIIGDKNYNVTEEALGMLKKLEYRGYDSAGITILKNRTFNIVKSVGKIRNLEEKIPNNFISNIAIAHTRWATHGEVNETNAHPHISYKNDISIVHNGIIENYKDLKKFLINENYKFHGETDSEVICNLVSYNFSKLGNIEDAFFTSINQLSGSYAIVLMEKSEPDRLLIAKNGSPLLIGLGNMKNIVASSMVAFCGITNKIIQLKDKEISIIDNKKVEVFNLERKKIEKTVETIQIDDNEAIKGDFEHYMLKEIYEQPEVLKKTIIEYVDEKKKEILFPKSNLDLSTIETLTIVACGTSYHAGCIAKYFIEDIAGVFVNVDIASEFRYRTNPMKKNNLAIFISQSGETADTLAALKYCKDRNQKVLSIVNVIQSAIANSSDAVLKTMAGTEIGVASTKAFTAQVSLLYLLAIEIARQKDKISIFRYHELINNFIKSVKILEKSLDIDKISKIKNISKILAKTNHILYIGRDILYPMALEGALKIKEVSYIPTQGIASGELKHGTIALVDKDMFVIVLNNSNILHEKNISSIEEILARGGKIIMIGDIYDREDDLFAFLQTPKTENKFETLLSFIIPIQLLAYYTSLARGIDVDKPRNLAKSVTVE